MGRSSDRLGCIETAPRYVVGSSKTSEGAETARDTLRRAMGPSVRTINHPHAFQHEQLHVRVGGIQGTPHIGPDSTVFADKGEVGKLAVEGKSLVCITVPRVEWRTNPDTSNMIPDMARRVQFAVYMEARVDKEAGPGLLTTTRFSTTRTYVRVAG